MDLFILQKEHRKKCTEYEQLKKVATKLQEEVKALRALLQERDALIQVRTNGGESSALASCPSSSDIYFFCLVLIFLKSLLFDE